MIRMGAQPIPRRGTEWPTFSKKTITSAKAKVAEADAKAFQARFDTIEAI